MSNLALTFWKQGRWEEAEKLEVQVMKTRKEKFGVDHSDTLTSMINLAHTWHDMGRTLNAVDLLRDCVRLQQVKLGLSHSETQSSSSTLDDWESKLSRHVI
ncbi:Kinesin light chain [Metarhizium anisopliae]|nr:Kinesin light chain [Metarhizium anisopliae]